jgi:plastocyanin
VLAALLLPAPAAGQEPPTLEWVDAIDNEFINDDGGPAHVTIAAGGHVNFTYFTGNSRHNVVFPGARPTVCGISEGPAGTTAALPSVPSPPGWEGGCDFDVAGTYAFVCGLHSNMTGSVTVVQTGASPPPPPAGLPDVTLPGETPASGLSVAVQQRGYRVRGSVLVQRGGVRLVAQAFAQRRALYAGSRSRREVRVARHTRATGGGVRVAFSAALNRAARAALRRNGRLRIRLRLTLTPAEGAEQTATRTVILRPPPAPRRAAPR